MNDNILDDDDDKIEEQSNMIRSAIAELLNISLYSLKEAFDSQNKLQSKLAQLDELLKPVVAFNQIPEFSEGIDQLNKLKSRVQTISNRISILDKRLQNIENYINVDNTAV